MRRRERCRLSVKGRGSNLVIDLDARRGGMRGKAKKIKQCVFFEGGQRVCMSVNVRVCICSF